MVDVLRIVGEIAGIAGLAMGVLLIVYRDFIRDLIRHKAFRTLSSEHATILLGGTIMFTFLIAVLGIFAGLATGGGAIQFIILVVVLLVFVLAVLIIMTWRGRSLSSEAPTREQRVLQRVEEQLRAGRLDEADRELSAATDVLHEASQLYWRARVALARDNVRAARYYIDKALEREPRDEPSTALKIRILLLSDQPGDRAKARSFAVGSRGISGRLDSWLTCLEAEGVFEPGIRTGTELDAKCPYTAIAALKPAPSSNRGIQGGKP